MVLFVGSGSTKLPVAFSNTTKLSISTSAINATTKDSGIFNEKFPGHLDWNMSTDGLMSYTVSGSTNSIDDIYVLMLTRTPVSIYFASKTGSSPSWTVDATKKVFSGSAIITSLDMNADIDNATYSIKLEGTGALTLA